MFHRQSQGGISRYFVELIKELSLYSELKIMAFTGDSQNIHLKEILSNTNIDFKLTNQGKGKLTSIIKLWTHSKTKSIQDCSIELIKEGDYDIFHPTFYDDYFLEHLGDKKFVLTVHDLIFQKYPEFFIDHNTPDKSIKLLNRASHIIAISESTKRDLITYFPIDENKVTVIHHGSPYKEEKSSFEMNLAESEYEYFLFVGERAGYKNFYYFISSISNFLKEQNALRLICVGSPFTDSEIRYLNKLEIQDQVIQLSADDNKLQKLYRSAIALVYPSIDEGFGLPILEAFVNGCPVICSDIDIFQEIANDAVIYFNPKEKNSIINAVSIAYFSLSNRNEIIEMAYSQAQLFTWSDCAAKTRDVYKRIFDE